MKTLLDLEEEPGNRILRDAKYIRSLWLDGLLVIVLSMPRSSPSELRRLSRSIGQALNTRVQVVAYTRDVRMMAAQLATPAQVLGVNMVWLPDGSTQYVVRISRQDQRLLPARPSLIEKALNEILQVPVRVRLE